MILGQLRMGARQTKNDPLLTIVRSKEIVSSGSGGLYLLMIINPGA